MNDVPDMHTTSDMTVIQKHTKNKYLSQDIEVGYPNKVEIEKSNVEILKRISGNITKCLGI